MSRKHRTPKPLSQNIRDLDDNLFIIRRQVAGLRDDPAYFKVLVAALRTFICLSSGTEGLLWRVSDALGVPDRMQFHGVGGVKPDHPLARGLRLSVHPAAWLGEGPPGMPELNISLREYIKTCEGVYFAGRGITWETLIKIWAQQLGLSHESEGLDPELVAMHQFPISIQALRQGLVTISEFAISVGERVLSTAEAEHGYKRAIRSGHGDLSVFAVIEVLEQPVGKFSIFEMRCPLVDAVVRCEVLPSQVVYTVEQQGKDIGQVGLPFPRSGRATVYALQYSSNTRQIGMCMTDLVDEDQEAERAQCDGGWMEAIEVRSPKVLEFPQSIVFCHGVGLHENWLGTSDLRSLFRLPGALSV